MFEIIEDPQFVEDVRVDVPDGEGWRKDVLRTRFRAIPVSEMEELENSGGAKAVLDRIVVSFEQLVDRDKKPVDGAGEWRTKLLEFAFVRSAIIRHYYVASAGLRSGNSASSAAPGLAPN
ncbi:hypothetical protein LX70_02675 [Defluviimonas denitrificans]|jgi:hypothetical protein|uniref:Uncharacterized protein n=1 Tax=Albidovulum denitrificans TaxID=404881 RepID=A0A2S8S6G3_9RHOB|nr:hypothetical protein [Defluviimonas denitrificans]PQV56409.1 hypothetical protein LX70_02675 [Defluviimonas denitrificans]